VNMSLNGPDRYTIMIVDDNRHLLVALGDYLTFQGYDVVTAATGEEALRKLERGGADLIVLDIGMPGMGGMGFLRRITVGGGRLKYPVIVLTARTGMEDFFEDLEVEGVLSKPCPEPELARNIREVLSRRAAQARAAARGGRRILIVEDDLPVLADIESIMTAAGYEVDSADNAHEVLEKATTVRPDAILMKESLPRMSGTLIASLLGAMPSTRGIPLVLYDPAQTVDSTARKWTNKQVKVVNTSKPEELLASVEQILGIA